WEDLNQKIGLLLDNTDLQKDTLEEGLTQQVNLSQKNRIILGEFLKENGTMPGED
ncbi:MAG TPA: hypothetical protein HA271_05880, partial [Methanobacterium subterraneum]|nr:hypothetical protein [Methanobacterium subterraneum]